MRTLFLLRHAKSSWAEALPDHERPLAPRGARAARSMADHLESEGIRPALVLCSPARRTRETLDALRPVLGPHSTVRVEPELYGADAEEILDLLHGLDAATESAMVIGHNPGLEDLAHVLAGDGDDEARAQLDAKFPTAALATLELGGTQWAELVPGVAYLRSVVLPRDLG
jgi:phosphohistidine phosphatase